MHKRYLYIGIVGKLALYADDMSLTNVADNPQELKNMMEHDLDLISKWLTLNQLIPNPDKSKYILFHNKKKFEDFTETSLNIQFNCRTCRKSKCVRLIS